jgi:hypothetical protein
MLLLLFTTKSISGMAEPPKVESFEAHYEKSNFFRVVHADGVFGGSTPRGLISLAFYSERSPLPRRTETPLVAGIPGQETVVDVKTGVLRELEVNVIMDITVAAAFHRWLGAIISNTQAQLGISKETLEKLSGGESE